MSYVMYLKPLFLHRYNIIYSIILLINLRFPHIINVVGTKVLDFIHDLYGQDITE